MIKLLIAFDGRVFARSLEVKLDYEDDIQVAGILHHLPPMAYFEQNSDVNTLLVSSRCVDDTSFRLIFDLKKRFKDFKILLVTESERISLKESQFLRGPFDGIIEEEADLHDYILALRILYFKNGGFVSPRISRFSFHSGRVGKVIDRKVPLSKREIEIIRLVYDELSSEEIADRLGISLHTVNNHRKNIGAKLKLKNIVSLTKYARNHKLVMD